MGQLTLWTGQRRQIIRQAEPSRADVKKRTESATSVGCVGLIHWHMALLRYVWTCLDPIQATKQISVSTLERSQPRSRQSRARIFAYLESILASKTISHHVSTHRVQTRPAGQVLLANADVLAPCAMQPFPAIAELPDNILTEIDSQICSCFHS